MTWGEALRDEVWRELQGLRAAASSARNSKWQKIACVKPASIHDKKVTT